MRIGGIALGLALPVVFAAAAWQTARAQESEAIDLFEVLDPAPTHAVR